MSDFLDECGTRYLRKYYLLLSFRNDSISNFYPFLSDYRNIVRNLLRYSTLFSSQLKNILDKFDSMNFIKLPMQVQNANLLSANTGMIL